MLSTIAGVGRDFASGRITGKINELAERKRGEQEDEALLAFCVTELGKYMAMSCFIPTL